MVAALAMVAFGVALALLLIRVFRPSQPVVARDEPGVRSVAGVDAPEDSELYAALRAALVSRGARVTSSDNEYATELDVDLEYASFRIVVGWLDDDGARWKVIVDGLSGHDGSRIALRAVHDALLRCVSHDRVHWTARQLDAAGRPSWHAEPIDH